MLLCYTTQIAAYRPLLAVLEGTLLTSREVGTHLRYSPEQMSNLRRRSAKGPPWFKLPSGAVRYDAAEVMAWQIGSASGPLTMARVTLAISTCAAVPLEHRAAIIEHVQKALVTE